jgi:hypothetical protein
VKQKASACCVRNDGGAGAKTGEISSHKNACDGTAVLAAQAAEEKRDFSLRRPTTLQEQSGKKKRRPAAFEMTVGRRASDKAGPSLRFGMTRVGGCRDGAQHAGAGAPTLGRSARCAGGDGRPSRLRPGKRAPTRELERRISSCEARAMGKRFSVRRPRKRREISRCARNDGGRVASACCVRNDGGGGRRTKAGPRHSA